MVTGDGCNSGADGSGFGANNVPSGGTPSGGEVVAITVPTTSDDKEQPLYDVHIITPPAKELVLCGVVDLKDGCAVKQTLGLEGLNDEAFSLIRQSLMSCADMKQSHLESQVQLYFAEKLSLIEEALQNPKLDTYESEYFLKCRNQIKAGNFSFFKEKPFLFSRVPVCDPTFERGYIALISNRFESVCQPSYADLVAPERAFHPKLADHYNYNSTVIYNSNFYKLVSYGTSSNFAENAKLSVPYNIRGANQSQYITPFFCTRFDKSAGMLHTFSNDAFNFFKKPKNLAAIASAAATLKIICDHKMLNFNENDNFE